MHPSTKLIRYGRSHRRGDDPHGALSLPLYQTATFEQRSAMEFDRYDYARSQNPTREVLEGMLAELDNADGAFAYTSGVAALAAVSRLVPAGKKIIVPSDLYAGTTRLLSTIVEPQGIEIVSIDVSEPGSLAQALDDTVALVLVESPTNPLLKICDIRRVAQEAKRVGALLAVDATMLTPLRQRPLDLGADMVIHSATKFLGGHSDLTGGAVAVRGLELCDRLARQQNAEGTALAPFDSWLLVRGLKTLALRLDRAEASAERLIHAIAAQPEVTAVYSPLLDAHPGAQIHRSQASGHGAVFSFTTGSVEFSRAVVEQAELFTIAVSYGSVHSQITLPNAMSHASVPAKLRADREIPPDLVRISVGIEHPDDLLADMDAAFAKARGAVRPAIPVAVPATMRTLPAEPGLAVEHRSDC